tara:strand:- start:1004 stop:1105 length:102 start_codon:yes stop_codon:yes gene_type:complete
MIEAPMLGELTEDELEFLLCQKRHETTSKYVKD